MRQALDKASSPRHIAIIMDGNGRWAQARGLPRHAGHRAGIAPVKMVAFTVLSAAMTMAMLMIRAPVSPNTRRSRSAATALDEATP